MLTVAKLILLFICSVLIALKPNAARTEPARESLETMALQGVKGFVVVVESLSTDGRVALTNVTTWCDRSPKVWP